MYACMNICMYFLKTLWIRIFANLLGVRMSGWLASFIREADRCGLVWWVENPAGSYLWHMPEWKSVLRDLECNFFCADYCRWGAPYRKRRRFLCNTTAAAERLHCNCSTPNLSLCAYSKVHGCSWTQVAEPYPTRAACARSCSYRIGDAQNPGPRPRRDVGPFAADLELIDTVRPATRLLQARAMDKFNRWVRR